MRGFNKVFVAVIVLIAAVFVCTYLLLIQHKDDGRPYKVELERVASQIESNAFTDKLLESCEYVSRVVKYTESKDDFYKADSDYIIREIGGELYRLDYTISSDKDSRTVVLVNVILGVMSLIILGIMVYIKLKILKPFARLTEVPYELSKGNLTVPMKESKNKSFGRFIWGVNLLRENIEEQKSRELELQKEKKTLLLSLSHDIKTPLSAIKLYSKALSKGLYTDSNKQLEIAESINSKADEIEGYVSQIITASREDFLTLDVNNSEFYLSQLVSKISAYYTEKLSLIKTAFTVEKYDDCLLCGDLDRSIEVVQNIMENAIKYGDGKSVSLNFGEEENFILVSVKNSGNTLDENELPHIFESFYRGKNSEKQKGSGLGLYICRQLMHKMNGDIFAETDSEFVTITVVLPKA